MSTIRGQRKRITTDSKKRGSKNVSEGILKPTKRKTLVKTQPKTKHHLAGVDDQIRLNRYIASTGLCSRRQADDFIKAGLITVNDNIVSELGVKVNPGDVVKYNGEKIREEKKVYILLNKPKDYVTTVEDPHATKTVLDLVKNACKERIYPVGRLDRSTTGVLLLTNDGDLTKKLTHPKFNKMKVYQVTLNKNVKSSDLEKIASGVTLDDGFIKADAIHYVDAEDKRQIGIEIHSGRNRIVRRIFEQLGYKVIKLDRVYFAGLTKKGLPRGKWRFLTDREISVLKMSAYK
ncbi:MAG: rRNA pseudouridine synthase [Bacteroidales bacterium]|nr:rRNA pseudouridine synthase [Bacteroidales bacterium]